MKWVVGDSTKGLYDLIDGVPIHLICTSPPYNMGIDYPAYKDKLPWDAYWNMMREFAEQAYGVLVSGGRLAMNFPGYAIGKRNGRAHHHKFASIIPNEFSLLTEIIWNQNVSTCRTAWGSWLSPSAPRFPCPFEYIQVWVKGCPTRKDRKGKGDCTSEEFVEWTKPVWTISGSRNKAYPATFPEAIPERLIKLFTWKGDTVLDPFAGFGTTGYVADRLGRESICIDLYEKEERN